MSTSKWGNVNRTTPEMVRTWVETAESLPVTDKTAKFVRSGEDGIDHEMALPDFTENVRAGMDLLDKINPGWQDTIDLTLLDLESDQMCVLGQSWPLYAKMHDLIDDGDYKQFADVIFSLGDDTDRNIFAASIGCALGKEVFFYLNGLLYKEVEKRWGFAPVEFRNYTRAEVKADPNLMAAVEFFNTGQDLQLKAMWEHLTRTWITEITKAREEGRWDSASAPVTTPDSSTPSTESPVTVS